MILTFNFTYITLGAFLMLGHSFPPKTGGKTIIRLYAIVSSYH